MSPKLKHSLELAIYVALLAVIVFLMPRAIRRDAPALTALFFVGFAGYLTLAADAVISLVKLRRVNG